MSIRAFELVPIIQSLSQSRSKTKIQCIECWEDNLYIGTTDGFVVYYVIKSGKSPTGRLTFQTGLQRQQHLGSSKPVVRIQAIPAHRKLLVLCDGKLFMLQMHSLKLVEESKIVKGVQAFVRDQRIDLATDLNVDITVLKKKGLYSFECSSGVLLPHKDLKDLDDGEHKDIVAMARSENQLFVAERGQYNIIDLNDGSVVDLFPYDVANTVPIVKRLEDREFLLSTWTEGVIMGMCVSSSGTTTRPPLQWPTSPTSVAYHFPYVVALCGEGSVSVHSILDQQPKQLFHLVDGVGLNDTNGQIFVASDNHVSLLAPIPFETQVRELLEQKLVDEALCLAQATIGKPDPDLDAEEYERLGKKMLYYQRQAALTYFSMRRFSDAFELMAAAQADPREIICVFPGLLRPSSPYQVHAGDVQLPPVNELVKSEEEMTTARKALAKYLLELRAHPMPREWRPDIDTALVMLYAQVKDPRLLELIEGNNRCIVEDCAACLMDNKAYHALAKLYDQNGSPRQALDVWKRLETGEVSDPLYPGIEFVIRFVARLRDVDLVFSSAEWMLDRDQRAVRVFTQRAKDEPDDLFNPNEVLSFLQPFPDAGTEYLEYLVFEQQNTNEKHHTRLALIYLDNVQRKKMEQENKAQTLGPQHVDPFVVEALRSKLQTMLQTSEHYRVPILLERIKDTDLHKECAILYGKEGNHEAALDLLVHRLEDHKGAEQYCHENTKGKDRQTRQKLFLSLLRVYLVREPGRKDYTQQGIDLLNSYIADLDAAQVLALVPADWSIGLVNSFLRRSVRRNLHEHRMTQVEKGLARQAYLQRALEYHTLAARRIVIDEDTRCQFCRKLINDSPFACYPDGRLVHKKCMGGSE